MISSIKGLAYRFLMGSKLTSVSSILSIMISITLIVSMVMFVTNERQSFQDRMKSLYGNADLLVGYNLDVSKVIDLTMLDKIQSIDTDMTISPVLLMHSTVGTISDKIYTVGLQNDGLVKSRYKLNEDLSVHSIAMNRALATSLQLDIGNNVQVNEQTFLLQEIIADIPGSNVDIVLLPHEAVQDMIYQEQGTINEANFVMVQLASKSTSEVSMALKSLDSQLRIDIIEKDEFYQSNLQAMIVFVGVLSTLILIVSMLFIISNSQGFVYKYRKQMALMRCIGATRKQLFKLIWIQLSLVNVIGGLLALLLTWGIHMLTPQIIGSFFAYEHEVSFHIREALLTTIGAMIFIQLFMIIPAFSSKKILPLQMMSDNEYSTTKLSKRIISHLIWIGSIILLILGLFFPMNNSEAALFYLLLAILLIVSSFRLFPIYFIKLIQMISPAVRRMLGNLSYVSLQNIVPQIKKNTIATLMISVMIMIVTVGSTIFHTTSLNGEQYIRGKYITNINISVRDQMKYYVTSEQLKKEVTSLTGINELIAVSNYNGISVSDQTGERHHYNFRAIDLEMMEHMNLIELPRHDQLQSQVIISEQMALQQDLKVGDSVAIELYSVEAQNYVVAENMIVGAIYEKLPGSFAEIYVDWSASFIQDSNIMFEELWLNGQDEGLVLEQLKELQLMYPTQILLNSLSSELAISNKMKEERWPMFVATLTIMMISVIMGICNTLFQNIQSHRREYAIMRIIAVTERGISYMITLQFMLYISLGTLLGLILGALVITSLSRVDTASSILLDMSFIGWNIAILVVVCTLMLIPFIRHIRKQSLIGELSSN